MPGAVVALTLAAVVVGTTRSVPPEAPAPTAGPSPSQIAEPSPDVTTGVGPGPALAGATNADALPACAGATPSRPASPPPAPPVAGDVALRLVGQLGGTAQVAALDGSRILVGAGRRVIEVDLTDPRHPVEGNASPALAGTVEDIALSDGLLIIAAGNGGVAILDAATLEVRGSLSLPGRAEALRVAGTLAFVADGPGGLRIVDLGRPEDPVEVAAVHDLHRVLDVAVAGGIAYLAAADEGLLVVDVRDPASPTALGALFTGGYAFGIALAGDRVVLADGWGGIRTIDVSVPSAPRLAATLALPTWAMAVEADRDRVYAAVGADGLWILDVGGPGAPRRVADLPLPDGHAVGLSAAGGHVAIVDAGRAVRIVDVTGDSPVELSAYSPLSQAYGLAVAGDRAFIAARGQGLRVVDVSDRARPRDVAALETADLVHGVAAVGTRVLFGTWPRPGSPWVSSLYTLDLARPDLAPATPLAGPSPWMGSVGIGTILVIPAELGMYLIDAGRTPPCLLGYLATAIFPNQGFESNGLAISGDLAYLAPYFEGRGIHVADISDPRRPRLLGEAPAEEDVGVLKVFAVGPTLYSIEQRPEGPSLAVRDLARPSEPTYLGAVRLPAPTATGDESGPHLAYAGGRVFVADASGGLVVVDVADPRAPRIAGRLRLPGEAVGVVVVGRHAFVASDGGGLFVVEWSAGSAESRPGAPRTLRRAVLQTAGSTCEVKVAADDGPGSLRDCVRRAQAGTTVAFDPDVFRASAPATVRLLDPIRVPSGVTIDGTGAGVVLDGGGVVAEGLRLEDRGTVRSITVTGFGVGIHVDGSGNTVAGSVVSANRDEGIGIRGPNNVVVGNLVGLDPSGRRTWGTQRVGVSVGDTGNVIGGPEPADRNVISGGDIEIFMKEARGTVIEGNYIGTDADGRIALRSEGAAAAIGVWVGSSRNLIARNVITGGVNILDPGSNYNSIVGNLVDLDATGVRSLGNGGIVISEPFNRVGGTLPGEANILGGGIFVGASDVVVLGNRIGIERGDPLAGEGAVVVERRGSVIGGRSPTAANVVFGVIQVRADSTLVIGDHIRPRLEDGLAGIRVEAAGGVHVVSNLIEGGDIGIELAGGARDNVVRGNVIRRARIPIASHPGAETNTVTDNITGP